MSLNAIWERKSRHERLARFYGAYEKGAMDDPTRCNVRRSDDVAADRERMYPARVKALLEEIDSEYYAVFRCFDGDQRMQWDIWDLWMEEKRYVDRYGRRMPEDDRPFGRAM